MSREREHHRAVQAGGVHRVLAVLIGAALVLALLPRAAGAQGYFVGPSVNMVAGTSLPNGDPWLQRQNEGSLALSTSNPCTLFAGANDYRTVDIPGLPGDKETGDGWLGLYKSFDCGRTWRTGLLPGYPQDTSPEGMASPLKGLQAAADPVVRAGTNGLFFYSGMAFNREAGGASRVFVARFGDNNDRAVQADGDPIEYHGTTVVDLGTSGQFLDKPFVAVDIARAKNPKFCSINGRSIPAGTVYVAWTRFVGDPVNKVTKLMVARSKDCGVTFELPVKVSEGVMTNQGASMAVAPDTGALYLVWRQFLSDSGQHAIMVSKSADLGSTFSKPSLVANIDPFDQGTSAEALSFRTNSYPTIAADAAGMVYVAWAQRGVGPGGDARIVLATSTNGAKWSIPAPVDNYPARGHQIMPAITIAGGKIQVLYYDLHDDHFLETYTRYPGDPWPYAILRQWTVDEPSDVFTDAVADNYPVAFTRRHSIDVRTAQADVGSFAFSGSRVSQYAFGTFVFPGDTQNLSRTFWQMSFNPPNLPLYALGTSPFMSDYVDVAALSFVRDPVSGKWRFNAQAIPGAPPTFHAMWTDNRDVSPPPPGGSWASYTPPKPGCTAGTTGMRNSNVYTAAIMPVLMVGSLDNSKPLDATAPRAFSVFALNTTGEDRVYQFQVAKGPGVEWASFERNGAAEVLSLEVTIGAWSGTARTVYARGSATGRLTVTAYPAPPGGALGPPAGSVVINPDPLSPALSNPAMMNESYNASLMDRTIVNPAMMNPAMMNPAMMNPAMMNPADPAWALINPAMMNPAMMNPAMMNPAMMNPAMMNPAMMNPGVVSQEVADPAMMNPAMMNPAMMNPAVVSTGLADDATIIDTTWKVRNDGTSAASYSINLSGKEIPSGLAAQLILHKRYVTNAPTTSASRACEAGQRTQDVVVANIAYPQIGQHNAAAQGTGQNGAAALAQPDLPPQEPTMALAPGEEGYVTLRIFDPDRKDNVIAYDATTGRYFSYDPAFDPRTDVSVEPVPQPANEPPVPTGTYSLAFTGQPQDAAVGQTLGSVRVQVNQSGAGVAGARVTIGLVPNGNPGILAGTFTAATDAAGVATFANLAVTESGTDYQLRASVPGAAPVTSASFDVAGLVIPVGTGTLQFVVPPSAATAGQAIPGPVSVTARNNAAAPLPGITVSLSIQDNPGGATLSNVTAVTDAVGIAYFPQLTIDRGGYGYTLVARSGAVASAASAPFDVAGGPVAIPATPLPSAILREGYSAAIQPAGGIAPYTAAVSAGTLPPGVSLSAAGTFSGTPTRAGSSAFTVTVTDSTIPPSSASRTYQMRTFAVDQWQWESGGTRAFGSQGGGRIAQVFVSNAGGMLDAVRVSATCQAGDAGNPPALTVSVHRVDASGYPEEPPLASGTAVVPVTAPHVPGTRVPIQLGSSVPIAPGFTHALVLGATGGCTTDLAQYHFGNALTGDTGSWSATTDDLRFDTLITPMSDVLYPANWIAGEWAVPLLDGRVLVDDSPGEQIFDPVSGQFTAFAAGTPRSYGSATRLTDGRVLLAGGQGTSPETMASAEIFDPVAGTHTATGAMRYARGWHTATLLQDGRVLVAGGQSLTASGTIYLFADVPTAEIYDPATGTFSDAGLMVGGRHAHTATLLTDGRVLLAGGNPQAGPSPTAEIYDPASGTFAAAAAPMLWQRAEHTATLLGDGRVLVVGGASVYGVPVRNAEIFDPALGTFSDGGALLVPRLHHGALRLPDGKVVVVAGRSSTPPPVGPQPYDMGLASVEVWTPDDRLFYPAGNLAVGRVRGTALSSLADGSVLVFGGNQGSSRLAPYSAERFVQSGQPVLVSSGALPPASNGQAYSATFTATGGTSPYLFTIVSGALPDGLSLAGDAITGIPNVSQPGDFVFTVEVRDSLGSASYQAFSIAVDTLRIITTSLPAAVQAVPYSTTVAAEGSGMLSWSAAGALPAGLAIDTSGVISGTPSANGTYAFFVEVVDTAGQRAHRELTLTVRTTPGLVAFNVQPSRVTSGQPIATFSVRVTDAGGQPIPGVPVTLGLSDNPGSATLSGSVSSITDGVGVASFTDVSVNRGGYDYRLAASAGSVSSAPSDPFDVTGFAPRGSLLSWREGAAVAKLADGRVLLAGGQGGGNTAEILDPVSGTTSTGSMTIARQGATATLLPNGTVLVAGGYNAGGYTATAEIYDPATGLFTTTASMADARARHTATLLHDGTVLIAGDGHPEVYVPGSTRTIGSFRPTAGDMQRPRALHTATLLPDGQVLIAGGWQGIPSVEMTAETYDPATEIFSLTNPMNLPRVYHSATLLPDGRVLIAGGDDPAVDGASYDTAEVYDPRSRSFLPTAGLMATGHSAHVSAALPGGLVLIAGGYSGSSGPTVFPTLAAELFDPSTTTFLPTGSMVASSREAATLLDDGTVLLTGWNTAESYYPADPPYVSAGFAPGLPLQVPRRAHTATRLPNGWILVAGGYDPTGALLASAELCDPVTGPCLLTPPMTAPRARHTATLLPDGKVLLVGGDPVGTAAEVFDPATRTFAGTGSLRIGRYYHTATRLSNGNVLVTGGSSASVAEIYRPSLGTWTDTAGGPLMGNGFYSAAALLPNGRVLVVGLDTFTQLYDPATDGFLSGPMVGDTFAEGFTLTSLPNGKALLAGRGSMSGARLYDPAAGTVGAFGATGPMSQARAYHTATVLPNGQVLFAGGGPGAGSSPVPVATGELYNPLTNAFSPAGAMGTARAGQSAVVLPNGKVWIAGGRDTMTGAVLASDVYQPR